MKIPEIQPFQFIRGTAFSERVQLANKVNEIIDGINSIREIPDLQAEIDAVKGTISQIQTDIADTNADVSGLTNQVNTLISEVNGLLKEVISEVSLDSPGYGQVRVKVIHEDETETASNALQIPVIVDGGISLISGTTARSFKIRYITADGVTHTTNDFVIPEGGSGTDVTVTSVTILEGDTDNSFKFEVGLSDGSEIQSNSYPFPAASELTPATTTQLGGIKVGTHLSVTADGTLSVDMTEINTAAVASKVMFTADASKVTMHADSIAGSKFTKDIPQAAQGGAGTIDAASYQKIAVTESKVNALALTKPNSNQMSINNTSQNIIDTITGTVNENNELVLTINGKTGSGIPLPKGESSIEVNLLNFKKSYSPSPSGFDIHPIDLLKSEGEKAYLPSSINCYLNNYYYDGFGTDSGGYQFDLDGDEAKDHLQENYSSLEDGDYFLCIAYVRVYSRGIYIQLPHNYVQINKSGNTFRVYSTITIYTTESSITTSSNFIMYPIRKL